MADLPDAVPQFGALRDVLASGQTLRTWSVLVAVFGDLAPSEEEALSGTALSAILQAVGIRPEALRVALHRLRKDDWIESERTGRESVHRLTRRGRSETRAATPIIYAIGPLAEKTIVTILPHDRAETGYRVAPQITLRATAVEGDEALVCRPDTLPDWMRERVCPADLLEATSDLATRLDLLSEMLQAEADGLSPIERASLRILAIQAWRRIVLKLPVLSDGAFPSDWRGPECRRRLADILARLPRPSLDDIEMAARGR